LTSRLDSRYRDWLRQKFNGDIDAYNKAYVEEQTTFDTVITPAELLERPDWKPKPGARWYDWVSFKATLPAEFRVPILARQLFQTFLKSKYRNAFDQVPADIKGQAAAFEQVEMPTSGALLDEFEKTALPSRYRAQTVDERWALASGGAPVPVEAFERHVLTTNRDQVKGEMSGRNFRFVLSYIALHGRALWNTIIFCGLLILVQLIVNPLAAYALSRYPIKASGKILLFLLATMAFPAEVAMIPSFLLLKGLGLLNTFAALVLPAAASGYMIFLLKGFFDSLPQELFEAGQIDGAKETTLMMRVAFPLSKPVLGYMALLAFMAAYGSFLYAFLVAQDQKMWTLMVYIYQLQVSGAPRALLMAALTLAALPTLIVFLLCQRVIMRGIVLPGER
jgi:multiple sugar transport system permease protein